MAKNRQQKAAALQQLEVDLQHKGVVFFSYSALKVSELEELRKKLRTAGHTVTVAKRNLLLRALHAAGYSDQLASQLTGPMALAVGDDEVAPAKIVAEFRKTHEQMDLFGGLLEHNYMDAAAVKQLATLPSKPELLAKVVGCLNAPMAGFVHVLAGNLRGLVNVVTAMKDAQAKS